MVQRMTTQNFNSSGQTEILLLSIEKQVWMLQNSENPVLPINKVSHSVYAHKHYKTQSTLQNLCNAIYIISTIYNISRT